MAGYLEQKHLHTQAPLRAALLTYPGNARKAFREAEEDPKKTLVGYGQGIPSVFLTKVFASTKPDFIWMDVEHGMFDRLALHDCIQAAQFHSEGKSLVFVRVPKHDEIALTTAMDAGASALVIPHCESVEEVDEFVKGVYYPPIGHRSFSPWTFTPGISDASLYPNDAFNIATSNNHIAVIAQIESVKGVANVDKIAAHPMVHALLFGPGDFMADAGIPLKLGGVPDPRLIEAMTKFAIAGRTHHKPLLAGAQAMDQVPSMIEQGFGGIVVFMDVWGIAQTAAGNLQQAREYAANSTADRGNMTNGTTEKVEKVETNGQPLRA